MELPTAIWRKQRTGGLSPSEAADLVADFEADYFGTESGPGRFVVVQVSAAVLEGAAHATATYGLRAYDAVQLASALLARDAAPEVGAMMAWDAGLRDAAVRAGMDVEPHRL